VGSAPAHEIAQKGIEVTHPWVRETPKGVRVAAGYVKIKNSGSEADRLIGASLKGAEKGELHESSVEDGIARMRRKPDGIPIAPGETIELKPGALHIMFLGLESSLDADGYVDGSLKFEKAGDMPLDFYVEPLAAGSAGDHKHH
jgi:copper(I)-binding protein